ncbi:transferase family-domain-containing protein [Diplogelasinospora grovesii]|uniref:Transferase family-domain-containing protein n=1 Tax=Diplogelasinospora grovesii TaxID=303347 RepID=A0AAN6NI71_9PEZI|nr:transferase family-domain-containing protein [Diplogelasinospora grovesii]
MNEAHAHKFSPLDEIMPPLWMTLILCFPCADSRKDHVANILQKGLSRLVEERPVLAGKLKIRTAADGISDDGRPGSLSLEIPENPVQEVKLQINDLSRSDDDSGWRDCSYDELRAAGMPLSKMDGAKLCAVQYGVVSETGRVFDARLSFIQGGCFIAVSTCHTFADAWGLVVMVDMWARCCREIQQASSAAAVQNEMPKLGHALPSALFPRVEDGDYERLRNRPELWQLLGLDWRHIGTTNRRAGPAPFHQPPEVIRTCMFTMSPADMEQIKKMATPTQAEIRADDDDDSGPRWISTKDALTAFLWRSIIRARAPSWGGGSANIPPGAESMVSVAIDGRRALDPPIPLTYIGNVVFCALTWLPIDLLTSPETSLSTITLAIRRSIQQKARDAKLLGDAVRLAVSIPDVSKGLGNAFTSWFDRDLVTTSIMDMPVYGLDFGPLFGGGGSSTPTGTPEFVRQPRGLFDGICMVQPKQRNGMVDVIISLEPEQMDRLIKDEDFSRHLKILCE